MYLILTVFTDICWKHRPEYNRGESPAKVGSGPLFAAISARLGELAVCEDGGVGMPVHLAVVHVYKRKMYLLRSYVIRDIAGITEYVKHSKYTKKVYTFHLPHIT